MYTASQEAGETTTVLGEAAEVTMIQEVRSEGYFQLCAVCDKEMVWRNGLSRETSQKEDTEVENRREMWIEEGGGRLEPTYE